MAAGSDAAFATVCVAHKAFIIRHVCGIVADPAGRPIPGARVEVAKDKTDPGWQTVAGDDGRFAFSGIPAGNYELRVRVPNFKDAWQPIVVNRPAKSGRCDKSLQVRMSIGFDCSAVSVEKRK
jgi:hypothetical protein